MSQSTPQVNGLKVKDEGVTIANPALSMDFTGAGVAATAVGPDVSVAIPGGAIGGSSAVEKLTGTQSSTSVTLDLTGLAHTFVAIRGVYKDGQLLTPSDATFGWSRSSNTITILNADANQSFQVDYTY